jgi:hypothetical protein
MSGMCNDNWAYHIECYLVQYILPAVVFFSQRVLTQGILNGL